MQTAVQIPVESFVPHKWHLEVLKAFDNKLHRFFILNWHRRARKTTCGLNLLIREAVSHPNKVYLYVAPTYRMAKSIVWRDPNMMKLYLPQGCVKRIQETEMFVEFNNGSLLVVRGADDIDSIRGIDCQGVFMDEWSLIKPEAWEEAIRPIITQSPDRWAVFAFTPKGMNHAYDYWENSKEWADWWRLELRASTSHLLPDEEVAKAKQQMPLKVFQQEFECSFLSGAVGVFRNIDQCIAGDYHLPNDTDQYVAGLDLAKSEDYNVLIVINRNSKHVDYYARWNKTSWQLTKSRVQAVCKRYNNALCVADLTGVGDPIGEDLQRAGVGMFWTKTAEEKGYPGIKFTNDLKQQMVEKLQIALEQRQVTFPAIETMIDELQAYQPETLPSGKIRYTHPTGKHDDCVTALMLAVWGLKSQVYDPFKVDVPKTQSQLFWERVEVDKQKELAKRRGEDAFQPL